MSSGQANLIFPAYSLKYSLSGHSQSISSVKFSPDGNYLGTASLDKTVKIWRVSDGRLEKTLEGHSGGISDIAWSNDSKLICSASDDTTLILWNVEKGKKQKTLAQHMHYVFCCSMSVDVSSDFIASGSYDHSVVIWNTKSGKGVRTLLGHTSPVSCVHFHRDGSLLATSGFDGAIHLWLFKTGELVLTLPSPPPLNPPSEQTVLADAEPDSEISNKPIVSHIKFSPNGKYLLASTLDSTLRLWNPSSGTCLKTYRGHKNDTYCCFAAFSVTSGKWIVSGSEDGFIYLWDLQGHVGVVQKIKAHQGQDEIHGQTNIRSSAQKAIKNSLIERYGSDPDVKAMLEDTFSAKKTPFTLLKWYY
ncbi:WD repeat-containing protein 5 [Mitosporidium daphniae]